ncbi:MAG: hypothetical protein ACRDVK_10560 [Acidimicrobiia bacterium]
MTDKKTDLLSDEQIDHGPASTDDMAWKERVAAYEVWTDLLEGVITRYSNHELDRVELEEVGKDPEALIHKVSEATGLTRQAVEAEIREVAESLL